MIVRIALMFLMMLVMEVDVHTAVGGLDREGLKSGVVRVTATEGKKIKVGTGFIVKIDADVAYIVTAAHVVAGDSQPKVQFFPRPDVDVRATIKHAEGGDEVTGLALLMVRGKDNLPAGITPLKLVTHTPLSESDEIIVIGHPRGAGDWAVLRGSIASRQGRYVTIDANIDEGNSGGPIISNSNGEVAGLVGGVSRYGRGVTSGSVREYLEGHRVFVEETSPPAIAAKPEPRPTTQSREITGKDGAPMVLIPAGSFLMGSTKDEVDRAIKDCVKELGAGQQFCERVYKQELPQHQVRIDAFYLDKYEVTNRLFQQFVQQAGHRTTAEQEGSAWAFVEGKGWEEVKGAHWQRPEGGTSVFQSDRGDHPVVAVSWNDAIAFCRWAGKRLPTEAEFEYATRAGSTTKYWWGSSNPGSRLVENIADEAAKNLFSVIMSGYNDGAVRTASVGSYEANPWGLHDMSGNVSEWTADWYDETYYGKSPERNPKGPSSGEYRVVRGGSWLNEPGHVRSALRNWLTPTRRDDFIGFRCAQDVPK